MRRIKVYTILCVLAVLAVMSVFVSCDEHEPIDLGIYTGFVLCDDHRAMSIDAYEAQDEVKAVGVIFATETEDHPILAVMLNEISSVQFSDSLNFEQGTSADVEAYDGLTNTSSLQNSYDTKNSHGSPMAEKVFRAHEYGQSDYIPSVAEMRLLVSSLSVVNPIIERLKGTPVSTQSSKGTCWYWTSTEVASNQGNQAWLVSAVNGAYQETPKDEYHPARVIVSLNY